MIVTPAAVEKINRNMRCIEITEWMLADVVPPAINRNMRCIEIMPFPLYQNSQIDKP